MPRRPEQRAERAVKLVARQQDGREAEELLANPLLVAAFEKIDERITAAFNNRELDELQSREVWIANGLWNDLKLAFETVVRLGKDAEIELLKLDKEAEREQHSRQFSGTR